MAGPTELFAPAIHCDPSIIEIIPATYFLVPLRGYGGCKKRQSRQAQRVGQKHAHTPGCPPLLFGRYTSARCNAVQFGLEKEGCLPKVRIGDCDQEPDATCQVWRNIPWLAASALKARRLKASKRVLYLYLQATISSRMNGKKFGDGCRQQNLRKVLRERSRSFETGQNSTQRDSRW